MSLDDRGRSNSPADSGMFYAPTGGRYSLPAPSSQIYATQQVVPPPAATPPAPDLFTRLIAKIFGSAISSPDAGVMDGRTPLVDAAASRASGRWADPTFPRVDDSAQRAGQDGQDPTIAKVSAWQDRTAHAFTSTVGSDELMNEGEAPYRIQRPWVPGLTAWAGLNEYGFTQSAYRLRLRPMLKRADYAQIMASRRRNASAYSSTNTNASRRRIPAVRVPTAPLSGG